MWRRCAALALMMSLSVMTACGDSQQISSAPSVLPQASLLQLDGTPVSDFPPRGKITVLNVWATWCPPCRRELPSLERLSKLLDAQRFAVEGVALDGEARAIREYLRDQDVTFARYVAADSDALAAAWDVRTVPVTLIIDDQGRVIERIRGERVWHTQQEVDRLTKLAAH